jgi:hypothetical protein
MDRIVKAATMVIVIAPILIISTLYIFGIMDQPNMKISAIIDDANFATPQFTGDGAQADYLVNAHVVNPNDRVWLKVVVDATLSDRTTGEKKNMTILVSNVPEKGEKPFDVRFQDVDPAHTYNVTLAIES